MFMVRDVILILRKVLIFFDLFVSRNFECILLVPHVVAILLKQGIGFIALLVILGSTLLIIYEFK